MTRDDLVTDLQRALGEAAAKFDAAAMQGFLAASAMALSRRLRPMREGSVQLLAGQSCYPAPEDMIGGLVTTWGRSSAAAWSVDYTGPAPRWWRGHGLDGARLCCAPAPTEAQIARFGATMTYRYGTAWSVTALAVTVPEHLRDLLILRALPEALRVLAVGGVVKPVQLHKGMGSAPSSGTPQALHDQLLEAFEAQCAGLAG